MSKKIAILFFTFLLFLNLQNGFCQSTPSRNIIITYDISKSMLKNGRVTDQLITEWNTLLADILFNSSYSPSNYKKFLFPDFQNAPVLPVPLVSKGDKASLFLIGDNLKTVFEDIEIGNNPITLTGKLPSRKSDFNQNNTNVEEAYRKFLESISVSYDPIWIYLSDDIHDQVGGGHTLSHEIRDLMSKYHIAYAEDIELFNDKITKSTIRLQIAKIKSTIGDILELISEKKDTIIFSNSKENSNVYVNTNNSRISTKKGLADGLVKDLTLWLRVYNNKNEIVTQQVMRNVILPWFFNKIILKDLDTTTVAALCKGGFIDIKAQYIYNGFPNLQDVTKTIYPKIKLQLLKESIQVVTPKTSSKSWIIIILLMLAVAILFLLFKIAQNRNIQATFINLTNSRNQIFKIKYGEEIKFGKSRLEASKNKYFDVQAPLFSVKILNPKGFELIEEKAQTKNIEMGKDFEIYDKDKNPIRMKILLGTKSGPSKSKTLFSSNRK
ncbi:MAG: hypothetical protein NTX65_14910 [Ignavibacteriales bacterium]|nr:hypothetical protein [Ignavibacteriales bacterium]